LRDLASELHGVLDASVSPPLPTLA
jgi:hypothetical protein